MRVVFLVGLAACRFHGHDVATADDDAGIDAMVDAAPDASTLGDGLVAWWPLDDDPVPGHDHIGTLDPACGAGDPNVCPTRKAPGIRGSAAYEFNGTTTWLDVPLDTALQLPTFTVAAWVQFYAYPATRGDQNAGPSFVCPVGKVLNSTKANDNSWQICLHAPSGSTDYQWMFISQHDTGGAHNQDRLFTKFTGGLFAWTHVAISFDGMTKRIYVDGQQAPDTQPETKPVIYDNSSLTIGSDILTGGKIDVGTTGMIDDVRVYNRLLTIDELSALSHQ